MIYVSAVMPTTPGRAPYVKKAIHCFLAQTFFDVELLISSGDYSSEISDLIQFDHSRIRYRWESGWQGEFKTTGAARNAVNRAAQGRIIIHWDDDDWYAPERIADEVGFLISSGKQVVGYHDMLYYRESDQAFFNYRYQASTHMPFYATGTSLCYWRDYWLQNQFFDLKVGEDSAFSIKASEKKVLTSKDCNGMLVARAHAGSTSKPSFGGASFPAANMGQVPAGFLREVGL